MRTRLHLARQSRVATFFRSATLVICVATLTGISANGAEAQQIRGRGVADFGSGVRWPIGVQRFGRWSVTPNTLPAWPTSIRIVWHGSQRISVGEARLEVRNGPELVGFAREVGNDAVLDVQRVGTTPVTDAGALSLWRSGLRIDSANGRLVTLHPNINAVLDRSLAARLGPAATAVDPGVAGPFVTRRRSYDLAGLVWPEYPAPIETLAEVTEPIGTPGKLPFVLLLHGRHSTCFIDGPNGRDSGEWPCPPGWQSIPSYQGYRRIAELLASQGKLVVSIAANGINGQDYISDDGGAAARSALIRHHLRLWAQWDAQAVPLGRALRWAAQPLGRGVGRAQSRRGRCRTRSN